MVEFGQKCRNCIGPRAVALADAERYETAARRALLLDKESVEKWEREKVAHTYQLKADIARERAETIVSSKTCIVCGGSGTVTGNGSAARGDGIGRKAPMAGDRIA